MNDPIRLSPKLNNVKSDQSGHYAALPSPPTSDSRSSDSNEMPAPTEPAGMPDPDDASGKRDTITSIIDKRADMSEAIDALGESIATEEKIRDSAASSAYSVDEIIEPSVEPAPAPPPLPPYAVAQLQRAGSSAARPFPGKNVPRPRVFEYGVVPTGRVTPAPALAESPPPSLPSSPYQRSEHASLQPAPLFQKPKSSTEDARWDEEDDHSGHEDFSSPRPAPTPKRVTDASSVLDHGGTPPTPDPNNPNWPLAPPPASSPPVPLPPPQLRRLHPPPAPLNFNFSPDAYSRDPGPFTPPVRMLSQRNPSTDTLRPSTAGAGEIGLARGLSLRRPDHGLHTPTGIADRFGTPLI